MVVEHSATPRQIGNINTDFMAAFRQGDSARLADLYTEDAEILPPNVPPLHGKPAIQAFWQGVLEISIASAMQKIGEFEELGDLAWPDIQAFWQGALHQGIAKAELETVELEEISHIAWAVSRGVFQIKDGEVIDDAKHIVICKRANGDWKWHRHIWNSSLAAR